MDIAIIKKYCQDKKLRWTQHIMVRLTQRHISMKEVEESILSGDIIEEYPDDYPEPSCLILGKAGKKHLHVVCAIHDNELWLITAYRPNVQKWSYDFKSRKE